MLEILESLELVLANTGFMKRDEHLTTYRSGDSSSQTDFLVVRKRTRKNVRDAKVIPGEAVAHQERMGRANRTTSSGRSETASKPAGTSEVAVEMLDALGSEGVMWTHDILKKIWNGENILEDWRTSILVPV
ncbi:uncharacterized protein LOC134762244 [Penaeus indicus]|uniref:uncharacterized protein LOC134762244 n=1 Tax=Penaeus indicus TaxID=29960 RepID=UPI00300DA9A2